MDWHKGKVAIADAINLDLSPQQVHYARTLRRYVSPGCRWLDVGCGHSLLPDWAMPMSEQEQLVASAGLLVGVDVDEGILHHPLLPHRVKAIGGALPFQDGTFDLVTANMVVEHVSDPRGLLSDVFRVLRPGGHFLFITPNRLCPYIAVARIVPNTLKKQIVWYLEHRREEDVFPTLYRMNDATAIARLAGESGFEPEELNMVGMYGELDRMGPLGWIECFLLKGLTLFDGKLQPDIIAVLKRRALA